MNYFFNFEKIAYLSGNKPEGCILCLIKDASDKVQNLVVHESAYSLISLNMYPYNPGHLMVFPKRHLIDLRRLSSEERQDIDQLICLSMDVLDETHAPAAYNIGCNMGLPAGASIEHLHYHIVPRYHREIGIAEIFAGNRVLVEDPFETQKKLIKAFAAKAEKKQN